MSENEAIDVAIRGHGLFTVLERLAERLEYASSHLKLKTALLIEGDDLVEKIRHFRAVSDLYDRFNDVKKLYNDQYDYLSRDAIPDAMRAAGVKTINVEGVGRVTVAHRYSATMLDKEAGMAWLEESGNEALIQRTVNSSTLSAFAKNLLLSEGKELPPDIFKVGTSPYTSITKA